MTKKNIKALSLTEIWWGDQKRSQKHGEPSTEEWNLFLNTWLKSKVINPTSNKSKQYFRRETRWQTRVLWI